MRVGRTLKEGMHVRFFGTLVVTQAGEGGEMTGGMGWERREEKRELGVKTRGGCSTKQEGMPFDGR